MDSLLVGTSDFSRRRCFWEMPGKWRFGLRHAVEMMKSEGKGNFLWWLFGSFAAGGCWLGVSAWLWLDIYPAAKEILNAD